ncbi:MAG: alpha-mannosidase, partial [Oscillospiraceae bacterium]|nr:alpha-mannosidase [Oscillospiraceae bacterium]
MAFVKVVRRSMRPEEWTELRYGWIKRGIVQRQLALQELEIRDARQTGENTFVFDNDYRPLKQGDLYFIPDGTVFIRGRGFIPDTLRGQEVWLQLHTASELIVKINGKLAGGIDPNRDRILLNPWLEGPEFRLEIQGFYRSKPDDERNPEAMDSRGCRQVFDGAYLCLVNQALQKLYYDLTLLLDIAQSDEFEEDYRVFLNRELNQALNLIDFDSWTGVNQALQYIEAHIYQNTDFRSSGNVALVGHSHLDIAYYWRRMHVVQKNARTILIQLRLMDRYPDFKYAHTQPYTYELLKQNYPDLFAELKTKIQRGQFEPIGAMYVEPDCNLPAAESLIRQCLYGQAFYRQEFGFTVDNAWLPDVFGNSWILPQILRKSGVKYFVSNKMSTWNDTNRFPHNNFIWKGLDGSRIYACVPPTHFITWNLPSQIMENWHAYQDKEVGGQTLSMFGYGDGGSGVTEEMIELMHRFGKLSSMPHTEHCSADEFLHKNLDGRKDLAVWDGELYLEMHRGTFTTKSQLKALNREMEFKIRLTELVCSLALLQNQLPYPTEELRQLYKMILVNQFHDILPGSHIHPVFEDALQDYAEINTRLEQLIQQATKALGDKPSGGGLSPVAPGSDCPVPAPRYWFNPLNFDRQQMTFFPDEQGWATRQGVRGFYAAPLLPGLSSVAVACPPEAAADTAWLGLSSAEPAKP